MSSSTKTTSSTPKRQRRPRWTPVEDESFALKALYKMNWMLIYYVAILLELMASLAKAIKSHVHTVMSKMSGGSGDPIQVLQSHKAELTKTPNHLSVILSKDQVNYEDMVKLIYWAMGLGVRYFSLYDPKGLLKDHRKEFEKYILGHKILPGKVTFMEAIASHSRTNNQRNPHQIEDINANTTTTTDPVQESSSGELRQRHETAEFYERPPVAPQNQSETSADGREIRVLYVSEADGKEELAHLCKKLSESIKEGKLSVDQITIDFVDEQLREEFNQMPDPDLALYTGKYCCTFGFLPWHIRLTEFIPIGQDLSLQDFISVLYKYAKKEQRYGK